MICAAAKGFLTQSDCGSPAATMCSNCGRPMCTVHLSPASGFSTCYDCAATQPQQETTPTDYDDNWAHGYRASYYSTTGYRPGHYDSHDAQSFSERGDDSYGDESDRGGFDAS